MEEESKSLEELSGVGESEAEGELEVGGYFEPKEERGLSDKLRDFFTAELRKDKSVEEYKKHSLNQEGSEGKARILWAMESGIGNFDIMVVQLIYGLILLAFEKSSSTGEEKEEGE